MSKNKPETGARLFIGGFPPYTEKSELEEFCGRFGKVKNTDIIPSKKLAFVTFTSKEEATLAMFGIQQQVFKGSRLRVDWAKIRQEEKGKDKVNDSSVPATGTGNTVKTDSRTGKDAGKDVAPVKKEDRYIPGDVRDSVVGGSSGQVNVQVIEDVAVGAGIYEDAVVAPEPVKLQPIPNVIARPHYPEINPPLEVTIRDTQTHDIKYTFRVKSLNHLKTYLIEEANGEIGPNDLLYASTQKHDKNVLYGGVPVVHAYEDLLGKEILEPRDNKEKRENFINNKKKQRSNAIPKADVPLSSRNVPVEEVYHLLASKGYEYVLLNISANGPTAPLHPDWKPLLNTYTFRKGTVLVSFSGQTHVDSFQFINSTNQSYKDLLPVLVKYDISIFNSNKGAFITPEQLQ